MGLVPDTWFQMSHTRAHFYNSPGSFMPQHHGLLDNKIPNSTVLPVVNIGATDPNGMHAQEDLCQKRREVPCRKTSWPSKALQEQHMGWPWVPKAKLVLTHPNSPAFNLYTRTTCTRHKSGTFVSPPAEIQNYAMIHKARRLKIG